MTVSPAAATPSQTLLLRAVTLPVAGAVAAWEAWRADVAIDDLEPDSQWMLPLLYVQLRRAGVAAHELKRAANVYRHNWYKTHIRLNALRPVLDELEMQEHEPVLLEGAALAVAYFPALGTRPFDCVALEVPGLTADQAGRAERHLVRATGAELRWRNAVERFGRLDVHVAGLRCRVPGPADMMVHVCGGAGRCDDASALQWAVDAVQTGRRLDRAGWAEVERRAEELDLTDTVHAHLEWLHAARLPLAATEVV